MDWGKERDCRKGGEPEQKEAQDERTVRKRKTERRRAFTELRKGQAAPFRAHYHS